MQIKEMPANERPQEKLLFGGPSVLSNAELLALIIRSGTKDRSAVELANEVIAFAAANSGDLRNTDVKELTSIDGIGEAKACSIAAAVELSKRLVSSMVRETGPRINSPQDISRLLAEEMMYEKRELFMTLFLNVKLEIESKAVISIGSLNMAPVHPREVFGPAVRRGAAAIIVAHNHPTGDPTPSDEDIAITKRLHDASVILGISLIDHIIVGNGKYFSMKDSGYL